MNLSSEDLPRHLSSGLKPLYVVYGDALLLAIEAGDSIRAAARAEGYSERETFIAEQHFKWAELKNSTQSLSLFADKKVIDIRIPTGKPGVEGGQALKRMAQVVWCQAGEPNKTCIGLHFQSPLPYQALQRLVRMSS